ncbi:MAG TPA: hypothetical protein VKA84_10060 [Gemmatimonadaceae bacterium]|nr:hypothetical protein [Gemmatimonadaceae bacterium]
MRTVWCGAAAWLLAACAPRMEEGGSRGDPVARAAAEAAVYRAVVEHYYLAPGVERVVLRAETRAGGDLRRRPGIPAVRERQRALRLPRDLLGDFARRNAASGALPPPEALGLPVPVALVTAADLELMRGRPGEEPPGHFWRAFNARFPGARGVMLFSRVGFDRALTRAAVDVTHSYGDVGAQSRVVALSRRGGRWVVDGEVRTSVS